MRTAECQPIIPKVGRFRGSNGHPRILPRIAILDKELFPGVAPPQGRGDRAVTVSRPRARRPTCRRRATAHARDPADPRLMSESSLMPVLLNAAAKVAYTLSTSIVWSVTPRCLP